MKKICLFLPLTVLLIFLTPYIIPEKASQDGSGGGTAVDSTAYRLAAAAAQEIIRGYGEAFQHIAFPENVWEYSTERNGENWTVGGYVEVRSLCGGIRKRCWKTSFRMDCGRWPGNEGGPAQIGRQVSDIVIRQSTLQRIETVLFLLLTVFWTKNGRPA